MPFERYHQLNSLHEDSRRSRTRTSSSNGSQQYVVYGNAVPGPQPSSRRPETGYSSIIPGPPALEGGVISPPPRPYSANSKRMSAYGAPASQYYPPPSPDMPASPRNETSPMLSEQQRTSGYFNQSVSDLSAHGASMYSLDGKSTDNLRPKGAWNEKHGYIAQMPRLSHGRVVKKNNKSKLRWWLLGILLFLLAAGAAVVAVILVRNKNNSSSSNSNNSQSGSGTATSTSSSAAPSQSAAPLIAMWGVSGSTVTRDDGTTFVYQNPLGGSWCSVPFNDSAQAQADVPALNQPWDYSKNAINGVNIGGWLTPEPFISPALYEPYENSTTPAVDEYTLSTNLGTNLQATLTNHYNTFITEDDFYQIAKAGLNWVRIGVPFWAIETIAGEPFLEGVQWPYFLKAIAWARKYGLRINLDFHAVPGSQNGWNHSGKLGYVGFLHGPMGIANAQRTMNYIRTLTEFISQPQYTNVIAMFSFINEPLLATIGRPQLESFYYQIYTMIRSITGVGKGPFLTFHDGFADVSLWYGFMQGADRVGLDTHPYLAFGGGIANTIQQDIVIPCNSWAPLYNTTMNAFGFAMAGEFSLGVNDCGEYVNGVGLGNRVEGTYPDSNYIGSCQPYTDYTQWTPQFKQQMMDFGAAQMDGMRNWFFWTWKIGNSTKIGRPPNPMWSYQLGIQEGYMPANARSVSGRCQALLQQYNGGGWPAVPFTALQPWMTGGAGAGNIVDGNLAAYQNFPPNPVTGAISSLRYTQTGVPITLPTPTYSGGSTAGNGWANAADTARWYVPTAANYPSPYVTAIGRNGAAQYKRDTVERNPAALVGKRDAVQPTPAPARRQ